MARVAGATVSVLVAASPPLQALFDRVQSNLQRSRLLREEVRQTLGLLRDRRCELSQQRASMQEASSSPLADAARWMHRKVPARLDGPAPVDGVPGAAGSAARALTDGGRRESPVSAPPAPRPTSDPLQEVSDPATPGAQLRAWLVQSLTWSLLHPERTSELVPLEAAILLNPSLPFDILGQVLLMIPSHRWPSIAWYNPSVPLLLLQEPSALYTEAAARLLAYQSGISPATNGLERLVQLSELQRSVDSSRHRKTLSLARHLASLFSLPWAASTDSPCVREVVASTECLRSRS